MSILFFCADLHVPQHLDRYKQALPQIAKTDDVTIIYFRFPLLVHLVPENAEIVQYLFSSLRSLKTIKELCGVASLPEDLDREGVRIVCPVSLLEESALKSIVTTVVQRDIREIQEFRWRKYFIYDHLRRDVSLCLKQQNLEATSPNDIAKINFIKLTMISMALSIEIVYSYLNRIKKSYKFVNRGIIPDAYSSYLAVADLLEGDGIPSMILTADPHYSKLLKIVPLQPHALNIAVHNIQQIAHEYASPGLMFSAAKSYILDKIIKGDSAQAYSSSSSDPYFQELVKSYMAKYNMSLVYYTSSPDEQYMNTQVYSDHMLQGGRISRGIRVFGDEYELIRDLLEFCSLNKYGLIVRMHPRLGSDHRSSQTSSSRKDFIDILDNFQTNSDFRPLTILPEVKLSSYWLAAHSSVNVFFRSSIGNELSMLGLPTISPNHLDSYTYQGMAHETSTAAHCFDDWHKMLHSSVKSRFTYFVQYAVRGFYIQRFSSTFRIQSVPEVVSEITDADEWSENIISCADTDRLQSFIGSGSSLGIPRISGYWPYSMYRQSLVGYLNWLLNVVYPSLGVDREVVAPIIRVQFQKYHESARIL